MAYQTVTVKDLMSSGKEEGWIGKSVELNGWVYAMRVQGANDEGKSSFGFASIIDGSTVKHMQVIMNLEKCKEEATIESITLALKQVKKGSMIRARGTIVACPPQNNTEQKTELLCDYLTMYGTMETHKYPISKQRLALETTRHHPHLRPRTKDMVAVTLIHNKTASLIHQFFYEKGYVWAKTPLLTANDCEGAGETFHIWCDEDEKLLTQRIRHQVETQMNPAKSDAQMQELEKEQTDLNSQLRTSIDELKTLNIAMDAGEDVKQKLKDLKSKIKDLLTAVSTTTTQVDTLKEGWGLSEKKMKSFFNDKVHLSVSGQLHGEALAHGMMKIYTFGPTFRADPSVTSRHLAEFWMVEPEVGPISFDGLKQLASDFVKYVVGNVLVDCRDELEFLQKEHKPELISTLETILKDDFVQLSYTQAINLLKEGVKDHKIRVYDPATTKDKDLKKWSKKQYLITQAPEWGMDLKSEHERYFTDVLYQKPVIVYNYPKKLKPFYMKPSSTEMEEGQEGETVEAMDVLIPFMGELIGGSMREDDYETLKAVMDEQGITKGLEWYLDLRKYSSFPHGGFGLGFERLVKIMTGMDSIRDVMPFPRYNGHIFA